MCNGTEFMLRFTFIPSACSTIRLPPESDGHFSSGNIGSRPLLRMPLSAESDAWRWSTCFQQSVGVWVNVALCGQWLLVQIDVRCCTRFERFVLVRLWPSPAAAAPRCSRRPASLPVRRRFCLSQLAPSHRRCHYHYNHFRLSFVILCRCPVLLCCQSSSLQLTAPR